MKISTLMSVLTCLHKSEDWDTAGKIADSTGADRQEVEKILELLQYSPINALIVTSKDHLLEPDEAEKFEKLTRLKGVNGVKKQAGKETLYKLEVSRKKGFSPQRYPQQSFNVEEIIALLELFKLGREDPRCKEGVNKLMPHIQGIINKPSPYRYYKGLALPEETGEAWKIRREVEAALLEEYKLKITYQRKPEADKNEFSLFPLGIILDRSTGFRYLAGCRRLSRRNLQNPQFYRLDKIIKVKRDRKFAYPEKFSLADYIKQFWGIQTGKPVNVKVRFLNEARVIEKAHAELSRRYTGDNLTIMKDGSLLFEGTVIGLDDFRFWLRGFGSSAEVVEPRELRDAMIKTARELYNMYAPVEEKQKQILEKVKIKHDGKKREHTYSVGSR